jgi:hypothetical protein
MAMVSRLSQLTGRAVTAICTSAVHALRVLQVERVALVGKCQPGLPGYPRTTSTGTGTILHPPNVLAAGRRVPRSQWFWI